MTQPPITPYYGGTARPANNSSALASLILGICCYLITCIPYLGLIGWIVAIVAIVLGIVGKQQIARGEGAGTGMANAGIILGIVYLILAAMAIILLVTLGISLLHWANGMHQQTVQKTPVLPATAPTTSEIFRHVFDAAMVFSHAWRS